MSGSGTRRPDTHDGPGGATPPRTWTATPSGLSLAITLVIALVIIGVIAGITLASYAGVSHPAPGSSNSSASAVYATEEPAATPTAPSASPTPAETATQYKTSAKQVTVADISNNPKGYLGVNITFQGVVLGFLQNTPGQIAGVNMQDPHDPNAIIQVQFTPYVTPASIHANDTLTIWGQGTGSIVSVNGVGQSIAEGAVNELYLSDVTSGYTDDHITDPQGYIAGGG